MNHNTSVWDRYRPGFVDPLYVPYIKTEIKDSKGNSVPVNTWQKIGYSNGLVNPDIVRINWGLSFTRKHASDPCPVGFISGDGGFCFPLKPEHEPVFYTDKAFIAKRQFFRGYQTDEKHQQRKISDSFDMRSVSPFTGTYTTFYDGSRDHSYTGNSNSRNKTKYGRQPTRDNYL
jgi:hypothetical protein